MGPWWWAHSERQLVSKHQLRKELMQYAKPGKTGVGLDAAGLLQLRAGLEALSLGDLARSILPLLQQDVSGADTLRQPPEPWRFALHALETPAPACQLLPRSCHPAAVELQETGFLSSSAWDVVQKHTPVLHMLLTDVLITKPTAAAGGIGLSAVKQFVCDLLKVRARNQNSCFLVQKRLGFRTAMILRETSGACTCSYSTTVPKDRKYSSASPEAVR